MDRCIEKDQRCERILKIVKIVYLLVGAALTVQGWLVKNPYRFLVAGGTLLVVPVLNFLRRQLKIEGGYQLEVFLYLFTFLGWTLGGAAEVYGLVPGFDKLVHCLSGVFVAVMALAFYRILERRHSREGENPATGCFFVFFASMAVAGLFELCEFTLAPIMGRDLQHVLDTGVGDTMWDMIVCLVGTLVVVGLMIRTARGKRDFFSDAVDAFVAQNPAKDK